MKENRYYYEFSKQQRQPIVNKKLSLAKQSPEQCVPNSLAHCCDVIKPGP
jgi:hypothetical protein